MTVEREKKKLYTIKLCEENYISNEVHYCVRKMDIDVSQEKKKKICAKNKITNIEYNFDFLFFFFLCNLDKFF